MTRILHLTTGSKIAGAEKLLIGISKKHDKSRFELIFCTLKKRGDLHDEIEKLGQKCYSLEYSNIFCLPMAILKLVHLIKRNKIDILHTHLFHASVLGQFVARFNNKVITVMTRHYSNVLYLYGTKSQRFLDRCSSSWARHVIAISAGVRKALVDLEGVRPGKITVIHNGVEMPDDYPDKVNASRIRNEFFIKEGEKVVGAIGSLHPRKGHRYLIEAISKNNSNIKLMIVGEGALKTELKRLSEELGIKDRVIFTGYRRDIDDLISSMDIVVHPSIEEGFGLAILEAMALGKIVVATDVGGIPEIINNGETGILVPCANADILAKTLSFLIERPDLSKTISEKGKKSVEKHFSIVKMVGEYENLYRDLLTREKR
ncbi:MAG: hypothetical protein A2987_00410 [Omnitrophica bacterium RIFCSPLOWO2_01_FULL_45_10]|nr:MAG: hypothetical protein A2987_00410 [Omnitrophica bacterium RIFCSPLOWO2_01_FULL_45_10]